MSIAQRLAAAEKKLPDTHTLALCLGAERVHLARLKLEEADGVLFVTKDEGKPASTVTMYSMHSLALRFEAVSRK